MPLLSTTPLSTMLLLSTTHLFTMHLPTNLHLPMKDLPTTTLLMLLLMTTLVLTLDTMKLVMDMPPTANTMSFFLMAAPKLSPTMLEMITLDTLPMFNTLVKLNMLLHQLTNLLLLPTTQLLHPTMVELSTVKPDNLYCHIFL